MNHIDVCLTPELLELYPIEGKIVVVVDILRATSCMTAAFAHGVKEIIPVSEIEECKALQAKGYLAAAERNGEKVKGFDFGNSPFSYMTKDVDGKTIAITTTNGTVAINKSKSADEVIIGSFLNKKAIVDYLKTQEKDVLVLCAGWKGRVNLEDSLYAGALVDELQDKFVANHDGSIMAYTLYKNADKDRLAFLSNCSHFKRLNKLNIQKDIDFCLTEDDKYDVIPVLKGDRLVKK